jgi:predicted nucleic acid-binding protein
LKTSRVAVDASFLLKLFLPEDLSGQVEDHWRNWIESSIEVVAPTLYDSYYVAVAKMFEAPLWTADERLYKSAHKHFPFINRVK